MADAASPTSPKAEAAAAFVQYARNPAAGLKVEELRAMLCDLGLLEGRSESEAADWVVQQFAGADRKTRDCRLDLSEFTAYYRKVTAPRLLEALAAEMPEEVEAVRHVFLSYAAWGQRGGPAPKELDGAKFIKLCKECLLVGRRLTTTDCDLIFARAKAKTARKITFEEFLDTLDMIAAKTGAQLGDVVCQVAAAPGPACNNATATDFVRFHDDTSTYTGMHAARRRSQGSEGPGDSARRSSMGSGRAAPAAAADGATPCPSARQQRLSAGGELLATPEVQSRDAVREAFRAFACFGLGSSLAPAQGRELMDSKQFVKLCRDSGILGGRLTATAADLAFVAKAKPLGSRKISFKQFLAAVEQLAAERGVAQEELLALIACCPGPSLNAAVTPREAAEPFSASRHSSHAAEAPAEEGSGEAAGAATPLADELSPPAVSEDDEAGAAGDAGEEEEGAASVTEGMEKLSVSSGSVINLTAMSGL